MCPHHTDHKNTQHSLNVLSSELMYSSLTNPSLIIPRDEGWTDLWTKTIKCWNRKCVGTPGFCSRQVTKDRYVNSKQTLSFKSECYSWAKRRQMYSDVQSNITWSNKKGPEKNTGILSPKCQSTCLCQQNSHFKLFDFGKKRFTPRITVQIFVG